MSHCKDCRWWEGFGEDLGDCERVHQIGTLVKLAPNEKCYVALVTHATFGCVQFEEVSGPVEEEK